MVGVVSWGGVGWPAGEWTPAPISHLCLGLRGRAQGGPKIAIITDGPKGAYVHRDGQVWFMPPYPDPAPPYERTGAGDAFDAAFLAAWRLGGNLRAACRAAVSLGAFAATLPTTR